jgi:hypothetical protein
MHGLKVRELVAMILLHTKLDQCPSSLNKVHSNLEKIGSHRVFTSKHFLSQVIFARFQVLSRS